MAGTATNSRQTTRPSVAATTTAAARHSLIDSMKDAAGWALIALLLAVPLLAFRTTETQAGLAVEPRWTSVAIAVAAAFVLRLSMLLAQSLSARGRLTVPPALAAAGRRLRSAIEAHGGWVGLVLIGAAAVLPATPLADRYIMDLAILVLTYVMLGWGLNIVVGLAGLLDLGYVAFYAVGAYSYALLAQYFGLSFWICLPLAGILAAFWGILLGFPVLRLRGDYLAIVTLAFGEIIRIVLINWQSLTGGPNGISGIPRPSFFGLEFNASCGPGTFCGFFGIEHAPIQRIVWLYYVILALALVTAWVSTRVRRLPIGRAWEALREDEIACRALGLNTTTVKLSAFAMGAMFAGFAGSFFATKQGFISPESFTFIESATILAIVVMGGMGSLLGIAIAAIAMVGGGELCRDLDIYRMLVFGLAMVAMMIWRPRGFIAARTPSIALKQRAAISSDLVKEGHG
jgi:branched-chain amino acid transport system permease protein